MADEKDLSPEGVEKARREAASKALAEVRMDPAISEQYIQDFKSGQMHAQDAASSLYADVEPRHSGSAQSRLADIRRTALHPQELNPLKSNAYIEGFLAQAKTMPEFEGLDLSRPKGTPTHPMPSPQQIQNLLDSRVSMAPKEAIMSTHQPVQELPLEMKPHPQHGHYVPWEPRKGQPDPWLEFAVERQGASLEDLNPKSSRTPTSQLSFPGMRTVEIPKEYYDDLVQRGMTVPPVIQTTERGVLIDLTHPATSNLRQTAGYEGGPAHARPGRGPESFAEWKRIRNARWVSKLLGGAGKVGLGAVGWGADLLMPAELGASTMYGSEFESAEDAREREEAADRSAQFLSEQPGYEPEGTPPPWADPEWSRQQRFGDEPEEEEEEEEEEEKERDLSPAGVQKSRNAAAKKNLK